MKKIVTILIGLIGLLAGAGFILPVLAKLRDLGTMPSADVGFYTLGMVLTLVGGGVAVCGFKRQKVT
jgi:hypothetical protein